MVYITILLLSFTQNVTFSMASRARNRSHMVYNASASILSNLVWFLTFRELMLEDMSLWLLAPYLVGTTAGTVFGTRVSMFFERRLEAFADPHIS